MELFKPSPIECQKYLARAKLPENEHYTVQGNATEKLFSLFPKNTNLEEVILKVAVLNKFYSTNIQDTFTVAKTICSLKDIDSKLKSGDFSVVNEIADAVRETKIKRRVYVFSSKYCAIHKLSVFPIFDNEAGNALLSLNKKYHFADFTKSTLRNYPDYVKLYRTFIKTFGLEQFSLREIDLYLWNLGKEISKK